MAQDAYGNYIVTAEAPTPNLPQVNADLPADAIDYAGPPVLVPPAIQSVVVDSGGVIWSYWGGQWN
jgi:hypothetical protein